MTFSAATNVVTELEATTDVTLVGEATGGSPNMYGDWVIVPLEHSGLRFRVSPELVVKSDPDDPGLAIEPDLAVALTSTDYFGDVDPAMEAILVAGTDS